MKEFPASFYEKLMSGYDFAHDQQGLSGERVAHRLAALSEIGLTENNGCRRIAFSKEEREAKSLMQDWMEKAGLTVRIDGAGNLFGTLRGSDSEKIVLAGSHLDSVPDGGHFDGPLGVLAALEVAEAWKETGFIPEKSYEVVVFTDEEGTRFHGGMTGSKAFTGELQAEEEEKRVDIYGSTFSEVMKMNGLSLEGITSTGADLNQYERFFEVHIEQGKRLEKLGLPVGVVTGIAGPTWLKVAFTGEAGHAGNTPMNDRKDALVAAGDFIAQLPALPQSVSNAAVATVGELHVYPNGVNVIPGEVACTIDVRDIDKAAKAKLLEKINRLADTVQEKHKVSVELTESMSIDPVPVNKDLQQLAGSAVREVLHTEPYFLPSGAGHDAMIVGSHLPAAMLFTKSINGISHNPAEWSELADCMQTILVLKKMIEMQCRMQ